MPTVCRGSLICFLFLLITMSFSLSEDAHALTVENIPFPDSTTIGGTPVPLRNAAVLRYLKVIKAYVAALYLPEGIIADDALSDVPKRLEISYLVSIKGPDFDKGAAPVLERNQTPAELARLKGRLDRINAAYKDVKSILWFFLIMTLGNIAMAGYILVQLRHLRSGDGVEALLLPRKPVP